MGTTYYEADWTTAYALARSGRVVSAVTSQFGGLAGNVFSHILTNGHTRVSDLINSKDVIAGVQSEPSTKPVQSNGLPNGKRKLAEIGSSSMSSEDSVHKAIHDLLQVGYLTVLHPSHLRPPAENVTEATLECKKKLQFFGTLKKSHQQEVDRAVRALLQVWKSNDAGIKTQNSVNHLNQRFQDANVNEYRSDKMRKVNGGFAATNDNIHLNVCLPSVGDFTIQPLTVLSSTSYSA